MVVNRRAARIAAYTSDFKSEAGVSLDFDIAETETGGVPVEARSPFYSVLWMPMHRGRRPLSGFARILGR